ncbi:MAG: hypothetical protein ACKUBY_02925 [Candidatus Moraniibacteriota bacterium]|jgi:cobalamin biosynthesis protein CobT
MFKIESKIEKFLLASMSVLLFIFVFSVFSKNPVTTTIVNAKSEEGTSEESSNKEKSENSEESENDEKSEYSENSETSSYGEKSEGDLSEESYDNSSTVTTTGTPSKSVTSVGGNEDKSEAMMKTEMKTETSEEKMQTKNESKEQVRNTVQTIEGFDTVVLIDGNKAIVKNYEKLFGIFKISIESNVELDDNGNVKNTRQNIWNKFLSIISV